MWNLQLLCSHLEGGRKERERRGGRHREREWRRDESQTLMVPEWGFVHLLHLACPSSSALSLTTPKTIKDLKYRFLFFFSPPYVSLFINLFVLSNYPCLPSLTDVYISVLSYTALGKKKKKKPCRTALSPITHNEKIDLVISKSEPARKICFTVYVIRWP